MSKTFADKAATPKKQPTHEQIDQFVQHGPGHDQEQLNTEILKSANTQRSKPALPQKLKSANEEVLNSEDAEISNPADTEIRRSANTEMIRLTVDLPKELHRRYKTNCSSRGVKLSEDVRGLIMKTLSELEG